MAAFIILILCPLWIPRLPAALVAMVVTGSAVKLFGLDAMGVQVIGAVPGGLPPLTIPIFPRELLPGPLCECGRCRPDRLHKHDADGAKFCREKPV